MENIGMQRWAGSMGVAVGYAAGSTRGTGSALPGPVMAMLQVLAVLAIMCALWPIAITVLITENLNRRSPSLRPLRGVLFLRNLSCSRESTIKGGAHRATVRGVGYCK
ncbi:MAG: hypothetical protein ACUVTG_07330 [Candidatus Oleimicrobiaceae bacterium]